MTDNRDFTQIDLSSPRDALEAVRSELQALRDSDLLTVNLAPFDAVAVVRGALPRLRELREQLTRAISSFDQRNLDRIELYALALTQAQATYQAVTNRSNALAVLSKRADELRARLLADTQVLVERGFISATRLVKLHGPNGHRNIAGDLLTLAAVLRSSWPEVVGRTAIAEGELDYAEVLGNQLVAAIGLRHRRPELAVDAARDRQRAFTLFLRTYDEVRRAVTYLRWHEGDADQVAPSLYAKRKVARKRSGNKHLEIGAQSGVSRELGPPSGSASQSTESPNADRILS